jgi:NhaA family Na+:H+ antiporter
VPASLKVFLAALAILDDLCAVLIIAVFYTAELSLPMLGYSAIMGAILSGLNRAGVTRLWPYLALGAVLWVLVLNSGVHATLARVVLALAIPLRRRQGTSDDTGDLAAAPAGARAPLPRGLHRAAHLRLR